LDQLQQLLEGPEWRTAAADAFPPAATQQRVVAYVEQVVQAMGPTQVQVGVQGPARIITRS
jgi:hypothetical protein